MEKLTKRQEDILRTVKKFMAKNGYPPTVREIGASLKLSSPATTHFHLTKLEEKGYIKKNDSKNRAMELLVENEYIEKNDDTLEIPLIGKVPAGSPIEAIAMPDEYFTIPAALLSKKAEVFGLKVSGDSMINAGIFDGDIAIIERKNDANNGDMVVAMTSENEVTLKSFYKEKDHVRLQPENDNMEAIKLDNVSILGKIVGLYRKI